uniref:Transposase IS30-like HTH domain-containing protein n=1 Tax=Amphiprion ocellaris TaxID=80972 RepID=A0AAQ5XD73_AMPOC
MAKAKKLSLLERGQIVELHKQGLSQCAIAAEVGRSKTVILNFLKDPEHYGTKKSSGRPKKMTPGLSRRIRLAVRQDTGRSSTQIKALTGADCSAITIRRHLREKAVALRKPLISEDDQKKRLQFAVEHKDWTLDQWKKVMRSDGQHHDLKHGGGTSWCSSAAGPGRLVKTWRRSVSIQTMSRSKQTKILRDGLKTLRPKISSLRS